MQAPAQPSPANPLGAVKPTLVKFESIAPDESNIEVITSQLQKSKANSDEVYEQLKRQLNDTQEQLQQEVRKNEEFKQRVDQMSNEAYMAEQEYELRLKQFRDQNQTYVEMNK